MYLNQILLFLILIINTYSRTDRFYTHCKSGAPQSGLVTYSDCRNYAQEGTHCCLLYYESKPNVEFHFNFKKANANNKEEEGRKLSERVNICFGLTSDGYNKIADVIDELEDESGIEEININCLGKNMKFNIIILIVLVILF